ncbi:MAG: hypothetical protein GY760_19545 [Deltaproteobacteria bacterium]|nr:hypothetical protein [Deltaproteobacteria bacterium]
MDASTIILGFTGSIGSGCTYIAESIPKNADIEYKYFKLSDTLRDILKSEGINSPSVSELQDKGNALRAEHGKGFLVKVLLEKIENEADIDINAGIIIDGIKNEGEIKTLRQFPHFFLFSVHSDNSIRQKRSNLSESEFNAIDDRDRFEEFSYGQQVKKCNYLSDVILLNERKYTSADIQGKKEFISKIYHKYVKLVELLKSGEKSAEHNPSDNELCMTTAYAVSRMSSCLKRKVGAVITNSSKKEKVDTGIINSLPCIVSTGYNEVPFGSYKCIYHPEFQKCYRDFLQEAHANKIKHCPECGLKIEYQIECPECKSKYKKYMKFCLECKIELEDKFKCEGCGTEIFKEFLPGEKNTPGKLLDMCRALHAEENALLNLINNKNINNDDFVLFVTTQPCNLCANKIVSTGIKKVIFEEPYSMKESVEILEAGGVTIERFQGVKSSAFFKLYQQ